MSPLTKLENKMVRETEGLRKCPQVIYSEIWSKEMEEPE